MFSGSILLGGEIIHATRETWHSWNEPHWDAYKIAEENNQNVNSLSNLKIQKMQNNESTCFFWLSNWELLQRGEEGVFFPPPPEASNICWIFMGPNPRPRKHLFFTKLINRNLIFLWISQVPPDLWKPWTDLMSLGRLGHVEKWWDFTQMLEMGCMMLHVTRNQFKELWDPPRIYHDHDQWNTYSTSHVMWVKNMLCLFCSSECPTQQRKKKLLTTCLSLSTKSWHFLNTTLH